MTYGGVSRKSHVLLTFTTYEVGLHNADYAAGFKMRSNHKSTKFIQQLEMWANAQRDGRLAEHRWRPLFNAAKFG